MSERRTLKDVCILNCNREIWVAAMSRNNLWYGMRLEVNAEKTKYMVMSGDQNAGKNSNVKLGNKSFQRKEQFKYLRTILTDQNSIYEEIKC
jgi:hypothetical protein